VSYKQGRLFGDLVLSDVQPFENSSEEDDLDEQNSMEEYSFAS